MSAEYNISAFVCPLLTHGTLRDAPINHFVEFKIDALSELSKLIMNHHQQN